MVKYSEHRKDTIQETTGGNGMDWRRIADHFDPMTCVLSVEKKPDGKCGTVRIVTGNQKYIDSIALASGAVGLDSTEKVEFVPGI